MMSATLRCADLNLRSQLAQLRESLIFMDFAEFAIRNVVDSTATGFGRITTLLKSIIPGSAL